LFEEQCKNINPLHEPLIWRGKWDWGSDKLGFDKAESLLSKASKSIDRIWGGTAKMDTILLVCVGITDKSKPRLTNGLETY
jgi:hypothetical protein